MTSSRSSGTIQSKTMQSRCLSFTALNRRTLHLFFPFRVSANDKFSLDLEPPTSGHPRQVPDLEEEMPV